MVSSINKINQVCGKRKKQWNVVLIKKHFFIGTGFFSPAKCAAYWSFSIFANANTCQPVPSKSVHSSFPIWWNWNSGGTVAGPITNRRSSIEQTLFTGGTPSSTGQQSGLSPIRVICQWRKTTTSEQLGLWHASLTFQSPVSNSRPSCTYRGIFILALCLTNLLNMIRTNSNTVWLWLLNDLIIGICEGQIYEGAVWFIPVSFKQLKIQKWAS